MHSLKGMLRRTLLAGLAFLAASCGGSGGDCGVDAEKNFVFGTVEANYLFPDRLPSNVNPASYATAEDLLSALMVNAPERARGRDFSFLTTKSAEDALFGAGQTIVFGVGTQLRPGSDSQHFRLFISKVEPVSPANDAGFVRGDEVLAIGP